MNLKSDVIYLRDSSFSDCVKINIKQKHLGSLIYKNVYVQMVLLNKGVMYLHLPSYCEGVFYRCKIGSLKHLKIYRILLIPTSTLITSISLVDIYPSNRT